jgi:hypothetical protein
LKIIIKQNFPASLSSAEIATHKGQGLVAQLPRQSMAIYWCGPPINHLVLIPSVGCDLGWAQGGWKNLLNNDLQGICSLSNVNCVYEMKEDERGKACNT